VHRHKNDFLGFPCKNNLIFRSFTGFLTAVRRLQTDLFDFKYFIYESTEEQVATLHVKNFKNQ